jgi:predicted molibdopterin-dependent oxidoreductase YjgC
MTNEELFQLRSLFRDGLHAEHFEYRVPVRESVYSDDFLIRADKNPNARGAELFGFAGAGSDDLLRRCSEGRIRFLYLCHHDLTRAYDAGMVRDALAQVRFTAYHGPFDHPTAFLADVRLPAAMYAEEVGTFTNFQGRVQRISAAVPPPGKAVPGIEIIAMLAEALGTPLGKGSPAQVFREIAAKFPPFEGMDYETLGDSGQLLKSG